MQFQVTRKCKYNFLNNAGNIDFRYNMSKCQRDISTRETCSRGTKQVGIIIINTTKTIGFRN
jgi:hypothetical protein